MENILITGCLLLIVGWAAYWLGMRAGRQPIQGVQSVQLETRADLAPDPELERIQRILANVDAYDGTGAGQQKLE